MSHCYYRAAAVSCYEASRAGSALLGNGAETRAYQIFQFRLIA